MRINSKKVFSLPVIIEKDESGYFVGIVPSLRSCYTQAKTLPELYKRLQEAVSLSLEVEKIVQLQVKPAELIAIKNY